MPSHKHKAFCRRAPAAQAAIGAYGAYHRDSHHREPLRIQSCTARIVIGKSAKRCKHLPGRPALLVAVTGEMEEEVVEVMAVAVAVTVAMS
eukprot:scaffold2707_cov417-Prasinococcus_capsulatus_cf.AAC.22